MAAAAEPGDERFRPYGRGASRMLYESEHCALRLDDVTYPDGSPGSYSVLLVPHAVTVLPVLDDGRIVLIRQWRYTLEAAHYELPAGKIHDGETLTEAAARELREETGYRARSLEPLPAFHPLMGLSPHRAHPFVARGLEPGARDLEAAEQIVNVVVTRDELRALVERGAITDVFALVPILYWLQFRADAE